MRFWVQARSLPACREGEYWPLKSEAAGSVSVKSEKQSPEDVRQRTSDQGR